MAVKQGIDSRGRKYLSVNGVRKPLNTHSSVIAAPKNSLRKFLGRWFGRAHTGQEIGASIKQLFDSKFNLWFSVAAKTSVGRQGRLYAMRYFLHMLKDKIDPKQFTTPEGDLDYEKFAEYLKEKHGVEVGGDAKSTPPKSDDAEILRIVHGAGLDAVKLKEILKSYTKSNSSNP